MGVMARSRWGGGGHEGELNVRAQRSTRPLILPRLPSHTNGHGDTLSQTASSITTSPTHTICLDGSRT